jgi:predicted membrane chloride channel (bestrophin family)
MVAANPLLSGRWTIKKFNATVINDIWPEVAFFSLVAAMVSLVTQKTSHSLVLSNQLLTVLGTVLGLVISFRTSSAYERYQDGRKMWSNINIASRNVAQMFWIHVSHEREGRTELEAMIEKKSVINIVQAFSVSVKHLLRGEAGIYYEDLYPLICVLPRYATHPPEMQTSADMLPLWRAEQDDEALLQASDSKESTFVHKSRATTVTNEALVAEKDPNWLNSLKFSRASHKRKFDPERVLPVVDTDRPLMPARNPPVTTIFDYFPFLRIFRFFWNMVRKLFRREPRVVPAKRRTLFGRKIKPQIVESNVPLEITLFLHSYYARLMKRGLLQPAIATGLMNNIGMLQDTLSNLERIANTPLPFAYQVHLRMSLWLYLFFLPFQIQTAFKYLTIPATAFTAFLLLGFLEIGQEIENPFNYDLNDLDLDHFCLAIQRELHEITAHPSPEPETYLFTAWNQPFAPADRRTAEELTLNGEEYQHHEVDGEGMTSIRRTLLKNWRDVEMMTRKA